MILDLYIENFADALAMSHTPALARMFAAGTLQRHSIPLTAKLLNDFDIIQQADWPSASLAALELGIANHQDYYFSVNLVHLDLRTDYFALQKLSDISHEHSDALVDSLNAHFREQGLFFSPSSDAAMMVMSTATLPLITTHYLHQALGHDIRHFLPTGEDALHWRMMINEIQMLLHDHPVNRQRETRNQLPVNSIWLEGGGRLPERALQNKTLMSNHDVVRGLAKLVACEHLDLLDSFSELEYVDHLVVWMDDRRDVDQHWCLPMLEALRGATVQQLNLYFSLAQQTYSLTVKPIDMWKFWRRVKPITHYFPELSHDH